MSQRVHPWTRWNTETGLIPSSTGSGAVISIVDIPPVISSTPSPSFTAGIPNVYDMTQHVTDDGESTVSYTLSGVLPIGFTFDTGTGILTYDGTGAVVEASTASVNHQQDAAVGTCYAGVRLGSSGIEYQNNGANNQAFAVVRGTYIRFGAATEVWVERTVVGSALDWFDPGAGRLLCSTIPTYGLQQVGVGAKFCSLTLDFYDRASGGVLLDSATFALVVTNTDVGGP